MTSEKLKHTNITRYESIVIDLMMNCNDYSHMEHILYPGYDVRELSKGNIMYSE